MKNSLDINEKLVFAAIEPTCRKFRSHSVFMCIIMALFVHLFHLVVIINYLFHIELTLTFYNILLIHCQRHNLITFVLTSLNNILFQCSMFN